MYTVIPEATTENIIQENAAKKPIEKLNLYSLTHSNYPQKGMKGRLEKQQTKEANRKQIIKW